MDTQNWKVVKNSRLKFLNDIFELFRKQESMMEQPYPNLRDTQTLLLSCDFAGDQKTDPCIAYSFLICDQASLGGWEFARNSLRQGKLGHSRTMSYKGLRDKIKSDSIREFLLSFDQINGMLVTILVDKKINFNYLFNSEHDLSNAKWKPEIFQKALAISSFSSMLIGGMSRENQDVNLCIDNDSIIANENFKQDFMILCARCSSDMIPHPLGDLELRTSDPILVDLQFEDILSLPDLACGAFVDYYRAALTENTLPKGEVFNPAPELVKNKSKDIILWHLNKNRHNLLKLVLILDYKSENKISAYFLKIKTRNE